MDKPQIIGLGLNGLVGSRILDLLSDQYEFITLSRSKGVDITNKDSLKILENYPKAKFVLHLAAKTDVDSCEQDKNLDKNGDAWKINVEGVKNVAEICRALGKKIIYFSTDFVFDGKKPKGESYSEEDIPSPINWYGVTKYEGEKAVQNACADFVIVRPAYPYRARYEIKSDFMRTIKKRLEQNLPVKAITDHIFCPTFIDDIAKALDVLIRKDAFGIYHIVGESSLSPYESAIAIADAFALNKDLISKTTREDFFNNKAQRPFNVALKNDKISALSVYMSTFKEGLDKVRDQLL